MTKKTKNLDKAPQTMYNSFIKSVLTNFFGRKNMTTAVKPANYTNEMVVEMVEMYTAEPSKETVEILSKNMGRNTRSIIAKLVREGVYVAAPRVTKTGAPVIRKSELVSNIIDILNINSDNRPDSLVKCSKADLEHLLEACKEVANA